jgi:hypothetical protein
MERFWSWDIWDWNNDSRAKDKRSNDGKNDFNWALESIAPEELSNEARKQIYEWLKLAWVEWDQLVFAQGFVDAFIVQNIELAEMIYADPSLVFDILGQLFTPEGIMAMMQEFGKNILNLASTNRYEQGQAFAQLPDMLNLAKSVAGRARHFLASNGKDVKELIATKRTLTLKESPHHANNSLTMGVEKPPKGRPDIMKQPLAFTEKEIMEMKAKYTRKLNQSELPGVTNEEKMNALYTLANEAQSTYDRLLWDVGKLTGAEKVLDSKMWLKDKLSAAGKLNDWAPVESLKDILRGSLVYENMDGLLQWYRELLKDERVSKVTIKDRLSLNGTHDILVNVELPNGMVAEVKLMVREIHEAQDVAQVVPGWKSEWSSTDYKILQALREGKWARQFTNPESIVLPNTWEKMTAHQLYEIRRCMEDKTEWILGIDKDDVINFCTRLRTAEKGIYSLAQEKYNIRTWENFIQKSKPINTNTKKIGWDVKTSL